MEHWGDTHHPAWNDALRIMLGMILVLKGISFISDNRLFIPLSGGPAFWAFSGYPGTLRGVCAPNGRLSDCAWLSDQTDGVAPATHSGGGAVFVNLRQGFSPMNAGTVAVRYRYGLAAVIFSNRLGAVFNG